MKKTPFDDILCELEGTINNMTHTEGLPVPGRPPVVAPDATDILLFSPHPDDEAITGGLALRLMREQGKRVVNVAVTLGSKRGERVRRLRELEDACGWLGFGLVCLAEQRLAGITPNERDAFADEWKAKVDEISSLLQQRNPWMILMPHADDGHAAHCGTHLLVMDALRLQAQDFSSLVVQTEFWHANPQANLLVELSRHDLAALVTAVAYHRGEVKRNAYHARLPAWMMDNVRRGAELVYGPGSQAPEMLYGILYQISRWRWGRLETASTPPVWLQCTDEIKFI